MNRHSKILFTLLMGIVLSAPTLAMAVEFTFHGDLNNRFGLYTNQQGFFNSDNKDQIAIIDDKEREDTFVSIKYRLWTEASSNDGAVKGVYAVELGAVRFGRSGSGKAQGGSFSGDGVNIETRWAYTDFQLPNVSSKARVKIGLLPVNVNSFLWNETATGVLLNGDNYTAGWVRGKEALTGSDGDWGDNDLDALLGRYEFKNDAFKAGVFGLYQWQGTSEDSFEMTSQNYQIKQLGDVEFDLISLGTDGSWSAPLDESTLFVNWDLIFQSGSFYDVIYTDSLSGVTAPIVDYDLTAFLVHADVGLKFGKNRVTYTAWYASGDDDATDDEFNAFITTDVDRFDSIVLFEGGYTDDVYFTERPGLFDKGLIFNKIAFDRQSSEKLKFGAAALYLMTAEDLEYTDDFGRSQKQDKIGVELDAYASYMLYPNVEVAINAGYLFADDAMDAFEDNGVNVVDGSADNDIFRTTARVRYTF